MMDNASSFARAADVVIDLLREMLDEVRGTRPRFLGEVVGLPGSVALPALNAATDAQLVAARPGR